MLWQQYVNIGFCTAKAIVSWGRTTNDAYISANGCVTSMNTMNWLLNACMIHTDVSTMSRICVQSWDCIKFVKLLIIKCKYPQVPKIYLGLLNIYFCIGVAFNPNNSSPFFFYRNKKKRIHIINSVTPIYN